MSLPKNIERAAFIASEISKKYGPSMSTDTLKNAQIQAFHKLAKKYNIPDEEITTVSDQCLEELFNVVMTLPSNK